MACCGHALAARQWMWSTALTSVGAMLAGDVGPRGSTAAARTAETASAALDVLRKSISIDVHTHGGKTGITSKAPPNDDLANAMQAGSLAVACLADVPDGPERKRRPTSNVVSMMVLRARRGATGSKYVTLRGGLRRAIPFLLVGSGGCATSSILCGETVLPPCLLPGEER
jgi:hypothetical protein